MGDRTPGNRTQRALSAAERSAKAMNMRAARAPWTLIAQECGYSSKGAAHTAVKRELGKLPKVAAQELRETELESLDLLEGRLFAKALTGNLGAVDRILKVKEQRAKLVGLYEAQDETGVEEVKDALKAWRAKVVADITSAVEAEDKPAA